MFLIFVILKSTEAVKKKKKNYILFPHGPGSCLNSAGLSGKTQHSPTQQGAEMAGKWLKLQRLHCTVV